MVVFQQVCGRCLRLVFLPVLPQGKCVKPGIPFAALDGVGFCLFSSLLSLPWGQPCFCSADDWVVVPKVEC